jgi:hypothetical protein
MHRTAHLIALLPLVAGCAVLTDPEPDPARGQLQPDITEDVSTTAPASQLMLPARPERTAGPEGTDAWRLTKPALQGQIAGYPDRVGGTPGTLVGLRVSTPARSFRVRAFRIGAYPGGGLLVWRSAAVPGRVQGDRVLEPYATRTVVAPWRDSLRVDTTGWEPGAYLLQMTTDAGWQAVAPYFVTSPSVRGRVVLVAAVNTWQAYNEWGGYSLYHGPDGDRRAWAVSFDRPYAGAGMTELPFTVAPVVRQAEATGVPLAYLTSIDLHRRPDALDGAAGFVSTGHDEYWTPRMRSTVEHGLDSGTNLAFLGANAMYWRVRLSSPSAAGEPRTMVGYRHDAALDPMTAMDPRQVTGRYRDPPAPDPEHSLIGMLYECYPVDAPYRVVDARWWGFEGTGVRDGSTFPHLVGNEADRVYPVAGTPRTLQVLSHSEYTCGGVPTSAQSTYYTHSSGAGVVSVGTLRWTCALTGSCFGMTMTAGTTRFVQAVTRNLVREFALGPVGLRHPSKPNVDRFPLPSENQVPAS